VDAEQGGVTTDWGTVIDNGGRVGMGTGSPDITTLSAGASLVDSNFHVAVFTWGGSSQVVYVDNRTPVTRAGVATAARSNAGFAVGGIATGEGGANRRFVGDIAEFRFYNNALNAAAASNLIAELTDTHIIGGRPIIRSFTANTNVVLLSNSVTLSWNVTNATGISIDNGIGAVANPAGSVAVFPNLTTTYMLTATNELGSRTAQVTVVVDPGVPVAFSQSVTTLVDTARSITLAGSDPNGGTLSYAIVNRPQHGTLSGTPPNVTFTPAPGYVGNDAFTFKVNDGSYDSPAATVFVRVNALPAPPTAIQLSGTDIGENVGPGSFIAGLASVDINPEETHIYTLVPGFGNNALFAIAGNQLRAGPGYAGGLGSTFSIRIRSTDTAGLFVEQTFALRVVAVTRGVVINEIHYNGTNNTIREEFIELHNASAVPVDLSLWKIRGGGDYNFAPGASISAGAFVVVAQHPATMLARYGVTALGPWDGALNSDGERITLRDPNDAIVDEVDFRSEFPWPIAANGEGASMQLVNPSLDNDLGSSWRSGTPLTPDAANSVFAANAAPNIRQVDHSPNTPASTNSVTITAKVTDPEGVSSVSLSYQVVLPGSYVPAYLPLTTAQLNNFNATPTLTNAANPAFESATNWTTVPMTDDGLNGDEVAGDSLYTVILPPRAHRTLVRYRITVTDSLSASRRAPFEDDPSLNFTYFVYDGVPAYLGFSSAALQTLPIYTLITRSGDLDHCTAWVNTGDQLPQTAAGGARHEGRFHFNWEGTVVYDGEVYDHVTYRLRGANGRYHNGKRSFRIRFKDGRLLDAKDQSSQPFPTKWRELTTGKGQSNRGSETFALQEVINYFLWNKVGVPAPRTFHFHFRVIRGASESGADQYSGDFWGLNWAQEKYDVNFLDSHSLPKGNLYKLVDNFVLGLDELRYQGPLAVTNAADFFNIENNLTGFQSIDWLLAHANYTNWYRYFAIAEAIRHYDIWPSANKNGAWYFEPLYGASNNFLGRVWQLPYDSTDTWGPTWNNGEDILFNGIFPSSATGGDPGQHPELQLEYRNVVREIRDLLFQPDQIIPLIDAFATPLLNVAAADHARWSNAVPAQSAYRSLIIPNSPGVLGGLPAVMQDMKTFMFVGGNASWWIDRTSVAAGGWVTRLDQIAAADTEVPARPTITYAGLPGYPADGLLFQSSAFSDPQGAGTFAAMQWRVAEITPTNTPVRGGENLKLEWDADWDSGELMVFNSQYSFPAAYVKPGKFYRARVRHKDNTGRWSRWSAPIEFIPTPPDTVVELRGNLVFSEIMYNPPALGGTDGDEFEFVELKNIGTNTLTLSGLFFSAGIEFVFTNGTTLTPSATFLLGRNRAALQSKYPGLTVHGLYSGRLNNDGETLTIHHVQGFEVLSVTFADDVPWPLTADGFGFSLVLADAARGLYRASSQVGGSPGADDPADTIPGVVINEAFTSSTLPEVDAIELHNPTLVAADLSGWYLTDDAHYPWKYRFPNGTVLPAGGYLSVDESLFNPNPGLGTSFALSSLGDDVYLFSGNTAEQLTGHSHGFDFGGAQTGVSFGRHVNSAGIEHFPAQISRTLGNFNSGPRVGPVVINEIHYNPVPGGDEFVELLNVSGSAVPLFDPVNSTNRWSLSGFGFNFPANVSLAPDGLLLVVAGDPAAFRAKYGVPAAVAVLGPTTGNLQGSGERLELQAPDAPTTNGVPYYNVDDIRYNDRLPWPPAADGAGASLQRLVASSYGNEPTNWTAAVPTPGFLLPVGARPNITSQPTNRTVVGGQVGTFSVTASGPGPLFYQWRFNNDRIDSATNSTLILAAVQTSQAGEYSVDVFNRFGSITSARASLTVLTPAFITQQPQGLTVRPGTNISFAVNASSRTPFTYQWRFNGAAIPGANSATLPLNNVQLPQDGTYDVVITDAVGPVVSQPAVLTVLVNPVIVQPPLNQTVVEGSDFTMSAEVTGNPLPIGYSWRRGSIIIVSNYGNFRSNFVTMNATAAGLILTNNMLSSNYTMRLVVYNVANSAPGVLAAFTNTVLADFDRDGIPDLTETELGLAPNDPSDAALDRDGDGQSNRAEFVAGTDPTNSASYLRIEQAITPGTARVLVAAVSNRTYTVQFTDNLNAGTWSRLGDIVARANNRVESFTDPAWTSNRLYRVVIPRQP